MEPVFVLLDDAHAPAGQAGSRLYTDFAYERVCADPLTLDSCWKLVDVDMANGLHATVFIDYEWGARLLNAGHGRLAPQDGTLRVLLFRSLQRLDTTQVQSWLAQQDGSANPSVAGVGTLLPDISRQDYETGIANILNLIQAGETYQVNYTYRLRGQQFGNPVGLYRRLRARQPVSFGCLAALPDAPGGPGHAGAGDAGGANGNQWVLSCSPELFVRNTGGHLVTRPMKGTAPRTQGDGATAQTAGNGTGSGGQWLARDPKNRAENVMIVDLLRNDLGRISTIGSVKVPRLFTVETLPTVHQMTSTVESDMVPGLGFADVLRALFPCGSITGTPKIHTMDLIAGLETSPRGLYCGAIGWVEPSHKAGVTGDFCLSVAIRTLQLGRACGGMRPLTLGVGGGVVMDSTQGSEYAETLVKARFLTGLDPGFTLFETLLLRQGKLCRLQDHLQRLEASALALGFAYDRQAVQAALAMHTAQIVSPLPHRIRLDLFHDGHTTVTSAELPPLPSHPVGLLLSRHELPATERALLAHKTSVRQSYDAAIQQAIHHGAFDTIFVNRNGEVTEGGRSNIFLKINGQWCTPPLASGVLPGTMRSRLLRLAPGIIERPIHVTELAEATGIRVCNALRGVVHAHLVANPP